MIGANGELSVRVNPVGGDVAPEVRETPTGWMHGAPHVLLLVHGFNNNQREAREAFRKFRRLLPRLQARVGEVLWPGDADFGFFQWFDFLSYPTEIPDARLSADRLAKHLINFKQISGEIEITVVGHSMGCRLILEMLDQISRSPNTERPSIRRIMLMAAAVPVELVEAGERLRDAGLEVEDRLVLYSTADLVLHFAFPAGQTLAYGMGNEPAVYLEAVGRFGNPFDFPSEPPIARNCNGHGSYWEDRKAVALLAQKLGASVPHEIEDRCLLEHGGVSPRDTEIRFVEDRTLSGDDEWDNMIAG